MCLFIFFLYRWDFSHGSYDLLVFLFIFQFSRMFCCVWLLRETIKLLFVTLVQKKCASVNTVNKCGPNKFHACYTVQYHWTTCGENWFTWLARWLEDPDLKRFNCCFTCSDLNSGNFTIFCYRRGKKTYLVNLRVKLFLLLTQQTFEIIHIQINAENWVSD